MSESLTATDYGKIAYEAYGTYTGGLTYDERKMPKWEDLMPRIQEAWRAAAKAVRIAYEQDRPC